MPRTHSQSQLAEQPRPRVQEPYLPSDPQNFMSHNISPENSDNYSGGGQRRSVHQPSSSYPYERVRPIAGASHVGRESRDSASYFHPYRRRGLHDEYYDMQRDHVHPDNGGADLSAYGRHRAGGGMANTLETFNLPAHHSYGPEPPPANLGPASTYSNESDSWPSNSPEASPTGPPKPKKARREKTRIELAPDQPPTTQGKPRARVFVACLQCRSRKIRCDGAKPVCHNCGRRADGGLDCNYDSIPKRRGPDKTPGARQRLARDTKNGTDNPDPAPRRRRKPKEQPAADSDSQIVQHILKPPTSSRQDRTSDLMNIDSLVDTNPLGLSPELAVQLQTPVHFPATLSDYSRSSYSPCVCHDLLHCPGLLSPPISEAGKAVSVAVPTFDDSEYDLASFISSYSGNRRGFISELDENGNEKDPHAPQVDNAPSLSFTRKIWWDSLLSLYLSPGSHHLQPLTVSERESASLSITSDLRFLFKASNYWFSFFHIPTFFGNFFDANKRDRIQPSLVLALLAMSTFWQSSEVGYGQAGRNRALRFRDEAQAAMDASFNAGWIDETLAQTAWLLALFEVCAHPSHSSERSTSSMVILDSIIRSLSLTSVDADDPNTTQFSSGSVPVVTSPKPRAIWLPQSPLSDSQYDSPQTDPDSAGCSCASLTLQERWPSTSEHAPMWVSTPAWDDQWSEAEIRKESCRRLCWSSMILAAGHISYTTAQRAQGLDLFIADPSNYALLFSGESVARSPMLLHHNSKDTIWALHDRSFLLWHGCIRMRNNQNATDVDKSRFAVKAWLEADSLEHSLNRHTCAIERASIFQAREYIFNTRMCISYEFQRYIPLVTANVNGLFHRNKAEEWLTHQATVAERFMKGLHTITGNNNNILARRPFFVFWFMGQIHRALALYVRDNSLIVALDVCKALIPAIDYLTILWPCDEQRHRYGLLRGRVADAVFMAGLDPLPPPNLTLPEPSSPESFI